MRCVVLALALVACGEKKAAPKQPVDAGAARATSSPPFHIELPGARIESAAPTPDGGAALAIVITRPLKLGATTFEPKRGPEALVVWIAGDGQPRAAHSFGLDGVDRVRMQDLVVAPDGSVEVGLVTSAAVPGAEGEPAIEPGGSEMLTSAAVDPAAGVTKLTAVRTVARDDRVWNGDFQLGDGAFLFWGPCAADKTAACIVRKN